MSIRNDITNNIVEILSDTTDPKPIFVTRDPIVLEDLSRQQFPAVVVTTGDEVRNEFTLQGANGQRQSVLNVICQCYVTGSQIDEQRNDICERVEEALEADRGRDGVALDTKLVNVAVDYEIDKRFGLITLTFEIHYIYTRGAA
jgi:regulator of RNase E activity RraB